MKKPSKKREERKLVNELLKAIEKNSPRVYVHVDRDSGTMRHTSSGWDFQLVSSGRTVFVEAKTHDGKLSEWQEFIASQIGATGTKFLLLRFNESGDRFALYNLSADATPTVHYVKDARAEDFF